MDVPDGRSLALGVFLLAAVDIIWVSSSELTEYIFKSEGFDKPFFSTYLKNILFSVYLLGFAVWSPWRHKCCRSPSLPHLTPGFYSPLDTNSDGESSHTSNDSPAIPCNEALSEPQFVAMPRSDDEKSGSGVDSDVEVSPERHVSFSRVLEVRRMPAREAILARVARLSFAATLRRDRQRQRRRRRPHDYSSDDSMPVVQVAALAMQFSLPFFAGQYCYQLALSHSEAAYVNILSSTSGLFTLILAALFPANSNDKFTLTKLAVTLVNVAGVVCVSVSDVPSSQFHVPVGALWAVAGAFFYAAYIVLFRAKVRYRDSLDLPMFFAFVGVCVFCLLWPGFLLGHYIGYEPLQLPSRRQWMFLLINGLVGTVVSELLWIWGCLLTSSLIATLSLSATVPLTMLADSLFRSAVFSPLLYAGAAAVLFGAVGATLLAHWQNWDPLGGAINSCLSGVRRICVRCGVCVPSTSTAGSQCTEDAEDSTSTFSLEDYDFVDWEDENYEHKNEEEVEDDDSVSPSIAAVKLVQSAPLL